MNSTGSRNLDPELWLEIKSDVRSGGNEPVQFLCSNKCIETESV